MSTARPEQRTDPATAPVAPAASARARATRRRIAELRVDRVACTGHGMCASILPRHVRLDAWGYPVVDDPRVPTTDGETAIRFCPARALYWSEA